MRGRTRWWPRACTRGWVPSRPTATGSASVGTAPPTRRASFTAPNRRGTTTTCASSPATSVPRCSSRTSGRRSAAPCSRPTATRSAMTAGCSCTTATSTSSQRSNATSSSPSTHRCTRRSEARPTPRCCSILALTLGLEDDPPAAVEQAIGLVEAVAARHGVPHPFQGTDRDHRRRDASGRSGTPASRTRGRCSTPPTFPRCASSTRGRELFQEVSDNARLIVSEPLGDVAGVWNEVPESTYGIVGPDRAEMRPFQPKAPATPVPVRA